MEPIGVAQVDVPLAGVVAEPDLPHSPVLRQSCADPGNDFQGLRFELRADHRHVQVATDRQTEGITPHPHRPADPGQQFLEP
ncbi:hypothetical protein OG978_02455 [Streptomyces sp. NBC_01591]|uniref:hypothetical protein n=1 Tax=Streptomyces sp. NBC_01591 TaxID=2975888 RepID=UPI002DDB964E|nr:hypothetical protein [Streptomyces sp. NBC_01591]WSD66370.1 hypothetical protein OG978_02455 [Streptomyces sp. NBC_01591]